MADYRTQTALYKIILEYLIMPKIKEGLKSETKQTTVRIDQRTEEKTERVPKVKAQTT